MTCHKRANWGLVKVLEAKTRHMPVQPRPQVQTHTLRHPIRQIRHPVLDQSLHHEHPHDHQENAQEPLHVARSNVHIHGLLDEGGADPDQT